MPGTLHRVLRRLRCCTVFQSAVSNFHSLAPSAQSLHFAISVVLRAFQGIGGGGLYTMVFVILPDMVTPKQYPLYATVLSTVFALSNLVGPILGGLINVHTTWRWIFLLKYVSPRVHDGSAADFHYKCSRWNHCVHSGDDITTSSFSSAT